MCDPRQVKNAKTLLKRQHNRRGAQTPYAFCAAVAFVADKESCDGHFDHVRDLTL